MLEVPLSAVTVRLGLVGAGLPADAGRGVGFRSDVAGLDLREEGGWTEGGVEGVGLRAGAGAGAAAAGLGEVWGVGGGGEGAKGGWVEIGRAHV